MSLGWTEGGTSMRDMVGNARRIVNTVDIPVLDEEGLDLKLPGRHVT